MKRTRKNLSDPAIRKILQQRTFSELGGAQKRPASFFLYTLLFLLIAIVALDTIILWQMGLPQGLGKWLPRWHASNSGASATAAVPAQNKTSPTTPKESPSTVQQKPRFQPVQRRIQVEVLNGCGVNRLAAKMADYLREKGIDVVDTGDYENYDVKESFLLNRSGNVERSRRVAELIDLPEQKIILKKNLSLQLDATLVLGQDYQKLLPFKKK